MSILPAIAAQLSTSKCKKILVRDGITSLDFTLAPLGSVFEGFSLDAKAAKKGLPAFGDTFSIAKNLDEYQSRICILVPSLSDRNPAKLRLQKYRIGIIAAFANLASAIQTGDIEDWNFYAKLLLEEASNTYVEASAQKTSEPDRYSDSDDDDGEKEKKKEPDIVVEALSFFGVPEKELEATLSRMYGLDMLPS
jgi:hypothetical protein